MKCIHLNGYWIKRKPIDPVKQSCSQADQLPALSLICVKLSYKVVITLPHVNGYILKGDTIWKSIIGSEVVGWQKGGQRRVVKLTQRKSVIYMLLWQGNFVYIFLVCLVSIPRVVSSIPFTMFPIFQAVWTLIPVKPLLESMLVKITLKQRKRALSCFLILIN